MLLEGYNHVHLNNWNDNYVIIAVLIPFHCFFMYLELSDISNKNSCSPIGFEIVALTVPNTHQTHSH